MQEGWDGLALGKALRDKAAAIAQTLPLGMTLEKVTDQAVNITSAVDEFMLKFAMAAAAGFGALPEHAHPTTCSIFDCNSAMNAIN